MSVGVASGSSSSGAAHLPAVDDSSSTAVAPSSTVVPPVATPGYGGEERTSVKFDKASTEAARKDIGTLQYMKKILDRFYSYRLLIAMLRVGEPVEAAHRIQQTQFKT